MNTKTKILSAGVLTVVTLSALVGCTTDADTASRNLSTAAEQFEIERRITTHEGDKA